MHHIIFWFSLIGDKVMGIQIYMGLSFKVDQINCRNYVVGWTGTHLMGPVYISFDWISLCAFYIL